MGIPCITMYIYAIFCYNRQVTGKRSIKTEMVKHMRKHDLRKKAICLVAPFIFFLSMVTPEVFDSNAVVKVEASTTQENLPGISVATNYVNIRSKASTSSTTVGRLYKGSVCTVKSVSGKWAKVTSGKVSGYIHTDYIKIGKEATALYGKYVDQVAKVTADTLRVREKASTSAKILGKVSKNTSLDVLSVTAKWVKVSYNGKIAYVSRDYVKLSYKYQYAVAVSSSSTGSISSDNVSNSNNAGDSNNTSYSSSSTTSTASQLIAYAKQFLGNKYVYGGTSLTNGTDCSGYTQGVFKKFGVSLPRTSRQQATVGKKVSTSNLMAGDLLFYATNGTINHVAIYIGNGQVIHASNSKDGIKISKYNYRSIYTARRVL